MLNNRYAKWGLAAVFLIILFLLSLYYLGSENQRVVASPRRSTTVMQHMAFNVTIDLENQTNDTQELVSISVPATLLQDGFFVSDMLPNYRTTENEGPWTSFIFARRSRPLLPPNDDDLVRVTFVANETGRYDTELVLWFNNQLQGVYVPISVEVQPHPAPWLGR